MVTTPTTPPEGSKELGEQWKALEEKVGPHVAENMVNGMTPVNEDKEAQRNALTAKIAEANFTIDLTRE